MTREEAIIELKRKITCTIGGLSKEEYNATVMAIEALQAEETIEIKPIEIKGDFHIDDIDENRRSIFEDIVWVVRCKTCRHWNSETNGCKRNPSVEAWYETDFCKYGERKDK